MQFANFLGRYCQDLPRLPRKYLGLTTQNTINERQIKRMAAPLTNPGTRLWRTDYRLGRSVYALLSNDLTKPSPQDPLVGVMESSELAENIVDTHNGALTKYGRHYRKALSTDD
jgi:hypothetical protein